MMSLLKVLVAVVLVCCHFLQASSNQVKIDSWCYKPHGRDCLWYQNCIQKRHPCLNNNYAMTYAHYFCKKFGEDYASYSSKGQQWVDGTRKCLQRVLVPFLDNFKSCEDLKQSAFDSHTCCYLAGSKCTPATETAVSICQVPFSDWFRVFWTIKDSFNVFSQRSDLSNSLKGVLGVLKGCAVSKLGDELPKKHMRQFRIKRSTGDGNLNIKENLEQKFDLKNKGVDWLSYVEKNGDEFHLLLARDALHQTDKVESTLQKISNHLADMTSIHNFQFKDCTDIECLK